MSSTIMTGIVMEAVQGNKVTSADDNSTTIQVDDANPRIKKRNRAVLSCASCHSRRVKCNRVRPCETCITSGKADQCIFASELSPSAAQSKAARKINERDGSAVNNSRRTRSGSDISRDHTFQNNTSLLSADTFNQQSAANDIVKSSSLETQYPMSAFFTFVERFQQHTQYNDRDRLVEQPSTIYPAEVVLTIKAACNDLPTPDRTRFLILFFFDQLDWVYDGAADYDEMNLWLMPFLEKMSRPDLSSEMFVSGDATRLCLIVTILITTIQGSNEGLIHTHFLDSNMSYAADSKLDRNSLKDRFDAHIRNLLDSATHQDGSSTDLIRSSFLYCSFLKNEGRHHESIHKPFLYSISYLVRQEDLHREPSMAVFCPQQRNSRRSYLDRNSFQTNPLFTPTTQLFTTEEPTYADYGLDFFDTMANSLTNPFVNDADALVLDQQQQQQLNHSFSTSAMQQFPGTPSMGMDDQMDVWLASLQTI